MKINLAENLLRFGAKNLSEESKQKLTEQTEWRGSAVLQDTAFANGTAKIYPNVYLTEKSRNNTLKPALVLKYSDNNGAFVGIQGNAPTAVWASTGGQVTGDIQDLVVYTPKPEESPANGGNEVQWIRFLEKLNTNNVLTEDGISTFFSSLQKIGVPTKFGTLTPDRLQVLKLNPDKIKLYTNGIAKSGVNANFKIA